MNRELLYRETDANTEREKAKWIVIPKQYDSVASFWVRVSDLTTQEMKHNDWIKGVAS